jgi:hypothetical protein
LLVAAHPLAQLRLGQLEPLLPPDRELAADELIADHGHDPDGHNAEAAVDASHPRVRSERADQVAEDDESRCQDGDGNGHQRPPDVQREHDRKQVDHPFSDAQRREKIDQEDHCRRQGYAHINAGCRLLLETSHAPFISYAKSVALASGMLSSRALLP